MYKLQVSRNLSELLADHETWGRIGCRNSVYGIFMARSVVGRAGKR